MEALVESGRTFHLIMIGTRLAHYEITSHLGTGGMGEVYQATDSKLGRSVAIKLLPEAFTNDADRAARFEREARVLASLNHPNIATIYGVEESGGRKFLVMELVTGETLAEKIGRGAIPLEESLGIAMQIAEALEAAHEKGVIHRDLKPANIKVTPERKVKVLDFGLARAFAEEDFSADPANSPTMSRAATLEGVILGTAAYMSPEQARGEHVDKRTDIWAWGVVLHEMLTGQRLFAGKTLSDTLAAVLMKEPDLSGVPAKVGKLLHACLERDPKRRLRDIGEAWRLLEDGEIETAKRPAARSSRRDWIAAAVAAVSTAAVAAWAPWRTEPEPPLVRRLEPDLGPEVANSDISSVVLSPDATRLLYSTAGAAPAGRGSGRGGGRLANGPLFIRPLNQEKAVKLSGTEGAFSASFSSDSQWIAYSSQGKTFKVSVDGGLPNQVAPIEATGGTSWTEDGSILIGRNGGLLRIPSNRGDPVELTQLGANEAAHLQPQMLPGSKSLLFVSQTSTQRNIEALSLVDGKRKVLVPDGTSPRYVAGYLVYLKASTLHAYRFDPGKPEPPGETVAIVNDVRVNSGLSIANDGTLVYRKGGEQGTVGSAGATAVIDWIAGDRSSPLITDPGPYSRPRFSPDGSKLALLRTEKDRRNEWIYDVGKGAFNSNIPSGELRISTVAWMDNDRILMGTGGDGIYWAGADGGAPPQFLLKETGLMRLSSYSPTLKRLAFSPGSSGIFSLSIADENGQLKAGTPEPFLTQFSESFAAFSPDGHWLAYMTTKQGRSEVKVRAFPAPASGVNPEFPVSTGGGTEPRWSAMKDEILYRAGDQIMAVPYTVKGASFITKLPNVRVETLGSTRLESPIEGNFWDLSPRDDRIAVVKLVDQQTGGITAPSPEHKNFVDELRRRLP